MKKITQLFILLLTNLAISQTDIWTSDSEDSANWDLGGVWTTDNDTNAPGAGMSGTFFWGDIAAASTGVLTSPTFSISSTLTTLNYEMRIVDVIGNPFPSTEYTVYIYDTAINPTGDFNGVKTQILTGTVNQTIPNSYLVSASIPSSFAGKNVGLFIQAINNSATLNQIQLLDDFRVWSPMSPATIILNPKVYLQGAALNPNAGEESLMRDDLRIANLIPSTSPYADALTCNNSVFTITGINAIVDWVYLELRDKNDNTSVLYSQSALLQRDGDVVDIDGFSNLSINLTADDFYITIKHRNHLSIMSKNTVALSNTLTTIDFTDVNNQITYGNNAQTTFGMSTGIVAMWAGNVSSDITIRYQGSGNDTNIIKDNVLAEAGNSTNSNLYSYINYNPADVNLDGNIKYLGAENDSNVIKDVILAHSENQSSPSNLFLITEQLPEN